MGHLLVDYFLLTQLWNVGHICPVLLAVTRQKCGRGGIAQYSVNKRQVHEVVAHHAVEKAKRSGGRSDAMG